MLGQGPRTPLQSQRKAISRCYAPAEASRTTQNGDQLSAPHLGPPQQQHLCIFAAVAVEAHRVRAVGCASASLGASANAGPVRHASLPEETASVATAWFNQNMCLTSFGCHTCLPFHVPLERHSRHLYFWQKHCFNKVLGLAPCCRSITTYLCPMIANQAVHGG